MKYKYIIFINIFILFLLSCSKSIIIKNEKSFFENKISTNDSIIESDEIIDYFEVEFNCGLDSTNKFDIIIYDSICKNDTLNCYAIYYIYFDSINSFKVKEAELYSIIFLKSRRRIFLDSNKSEFLKIDFKLTPIVKHFICWETNNRNYFNIKRMYYFPFKIIPPLN